MKSKKEQEYNHIKIEKKLNSKWQEDNVYKTLDAKLAIKKGLKPYYVLDMFPYPSGAGLHVGHPRGYIGSDVIARTKRMQGYNVLHPMGFDSFGLPAEQYAIKTGKHPGPFTDKLVQQYKKQLSIIGFSYDWDRMVTTHDPEYYKFTQEIFLKIYNSYFDIKKQKAFHIDDLIKIFEKSGNKIVNENTWHGDAPEFTAKDWKAMSVLEKQNILMNYRLAYVGNAEVNWCEELGTVLANDEIVDSPNGPVSERGEYPVTKKKMRQWFMRISAYGDRLIKGLDKLDFLDSTKETQKNWIGKSEGLIFEAPVKDTNIKIQTYSTHFEACYADTFFVIAPDHPMLPELVHGLKGSDHILKRASEITNKRNLNQNNEKEIEGVFTGRYALDPLGNGELPIWVASFALADYGTGIVKCSCHDPRDFAFAKKYNIPLKPVLFPKDPAQAEAVKKLEICFSDAKNGTLIEPKEFNGQNAADNREKIADYLISKGYAKRKINYKMRDAIFARQRYWGEPIPLYWDKDGIIHEVKKLPLVLPNLKTFKPSGDGQSPLANSRDWVKAGYETNTMPGWAGSSWYFMRYTDPKNKKEIASNENLNYFFGKNGGVDMYVGGTEHNTGHLLYARFWHKVLFDLGVVKSDEPFKALRHQGMIGGSDGRKMSKRWGNVINPDDVIKTFGADTLRVFEMFLGPFDSHLPWNEQGIMGSRRFIERVWRAGQNVLENKKATNINILYALNDVINKVSQDINEFKFNTAVSSMMIFMGTLEKENFEISNSDFIDFLKILAPFAPYTTDELFHLFGSKKSIHTSSWPKLKKLKERKEMVNIVMQVNGKLRGQILVPPNSNEEAVVGHIMMDSKLKHYIETGEIVRTIYVPGKLINFVVKL